MNATIALAGTPARLPLSAGCAGAGPATAVPAGEAVAVVNGQAIPMALC